jgi:hypothetical protein
MTRASNIVKLTTKTIDRSIAEFSKKYAYEIEHANQVQPCYNVTELIPVEECERIIRVIGLIEHENYNLANEAQANALSCRLIGSFVSKTLPDQDFYIDAVCDIFMEFSVEDGHEAIKRIVHICEYPPQPATLYKHLQDILNERKRALYAAERSKKAHEDRLKRDDEWEERTPESMARVEQMVAEAVAHLRTDQAGKQDVC